MSATDTRDGMVVSGGITLRSSYAESREAGTLGVNLYRYDGAYAGQLAFHDGVFAVTFSGLSLDTLRKLRSALDVAIGFTEQDAEASS